MSHPTTTTATGARAEVSRWVDRSPAEVWTLITDVARAASGSPECTAAQWQGAGGAHVGARFAAHNDYAGGQSSDVQCVVTEAVVPERFTWVVLDDSGRPDTPGSIWSYRLSAEGAGTRLVHRFEHGPGYTGLSEAMEHNPAQAPAILRGRLRELEHNMTATLTALLPA